MFKSLLKATVGTVINLPIAIVKDAVTLGGELTDGESAIKKTTKNIGKNLDKAADTETDLLD